MPTGNAVLPREQDLKKNRKARKRHTFDIQQVFWPGCREQLIASKVGM